MQEVFPEWIMGRMSASGQPAGGTAGPSFKQRIVHMGVEAGFCAVGVAAAGRLDSEAPRLEAWVADGRHASMAWMARDPERRLDPRRLMPESRSVIVGAMYYRHDKGAAGQGDAPAPEARASREGRPAPRISCYAWGDDYHGVVGDALEVWAKGIREEAPGLRCRAVCDTSAVMEKAWAVRAGVGWLGRNGCLIHPRYGSWIFLGLLLVDLELEPDAPVPDRCGRCRRCMDACPTGAIVQPGVVDSRLCISYRTLEHRGPFVEEWGPQPIADWLAGCDVCQDVCPWNSRAGGSASPRFLPRADLTRTRATDWLGMTDDEIRARLKGTALTRVKPADMRRNARALPGQAADLPGPESAGGGPQENPSR